MTITQMLSQSLILTLLGMSVVFAFLVVLIIFVSLSALSLASLNEIEKLVDLLLAQHPTSENLSTAVICAIYGENENVWNKYFNTTSKTNDASIGELTKLLKNVS